MKQQSMAKCRRLLSVLLVLLMVCGLLPAGVLAADTVSIDIPNAASAQLFAPSDANRENDLLSGTAPYSVGGLADGDYLLVLRDANGGSLGTIILPIGAEDREFTVFAVSVTCGNSGWTAGTDYSVEPTVVSGGSEVSVSRSVTTGDSGTDFPCLEGDSVRARIVPSAARRAEGYASATAAGTVSGAGFAALSATCEKAGTLYVSFPFVDDNGDGVNDCRPEVGQFANNYVYSYLTPEAVSDPENGRVTATYSGLSTGNYYYRVTDPLSNDAVTYGSYTAVKVGENSVSVTAEQMYIGDGSTDSDTLVRDFSRNSYDAADLYLSVNGDMTGAGSGYDGAAGELKMSAGQTVSLYAYRNWYAVESFSNSKVTQPDFHVQVLNVEGTPVTVTEKTADDASKHSFAVEAVSEGTAILLVTYDAMTHDVTETMGGFFSAIWPENTGVIVVSVGGNGSVASNMTINETLNTTQANKMVVDRYDAELDVLYYTGSEGASYRFRPEDGTTVSMAVCGYQDGAMTFGSFSDSGVSVAADGTVTLSGLTQGKTVVRLENAGRVSYQVLRAIHTDAVVTDASGRVLDENSKVAPGDTLKISFPTVYHPANKLSGIYNMSAALCLIDSEGNKVNGTSNQYLFASTAAAHTVSITVPADVSGSYSVGGTIYVTGFGSYYGYHRMLTYETGKAANMTAVQQKGYMGSLPELSFAVAEPVTVTVSVENGSREAVENDTLAVSCGGENVPAENGVFNAYAGKTYDCVLTAAGHPRLFESITVPADASGSHAVTLIVSEFEAGAWDGAAKTEPDQDNGVYRIGTGAELAWFAAAVNDGTAAAADAVLTADINLSGMDWTPIGSSSVPYAGSFDGQGHWVTGLYINGSAAYVGLFGKINNAAVRDLGTDGFVKTTAASGYAGGVVGSAAGTSVIDGCFNRAAVSGNKFTGGIVGSANGNGITVSNCVNAGAITGTQYVGGIGAVNTLTNKPVVTNCYNIGSVSCSGTYCGALFGAGSNAKTTVTNCWYLQESWNGSGTSNVNLVGTAATAAEVKALAETLGEAFTEDSGNVNGAYPIPVWMAAHEHTDADFDGICDDCLEELGSVKSASVDYASQMSGGFLHAPKTGVSVASNLAERYGYADGVSYLEGVSVLDVLVQAHIDVFGEAFTEQTAEDYLVIGACGSPDRQFGIPGTSACGGFFLNHAIANDGTESDWGGYNGTTVATQAVESGDLAEFFFYEDEYYGDTCSWFEDADGCSRSFRAEAGSPLELTLKGFFAMNGYLFKDAAEMTASESAFAVGDAQIYTVDPNTGALTAIGGAVTDEDGAVSLTFAEPGAYVIAAYGTEDCRFTQLLSLTAVEVSEAAPAAAGSVRVIIENSTLPVADGAAWDGTLVDEWVDIDGNSTMMSCVLAALDNHGYAQNGAENNYIDSINGLDAFDGGFMSGWMGTLNDWFTSEGFDAFTVRAGRLEDGDEIRILYTCEWGADIGSDWSSSDKRLQSLTASVGTLSPAFDGDTHAYTLTVPAETASAALTPSAANRNYQVRMTVGTDAYRRSAAIPVENGTVITVVCGDPAWPSMSDNSAPAERYTVTVEFEKTDAELAAEVDDLIGAIGEVTLSSETAIAAARSAYDALTPEQQALVTKLAVLTEAETVLAALQQPLAILAQPVDFDGVLGGTAVFTVSASGSGLSYQWQARTAAGTKWSICSGVTDTYKARITDTRTGYVYRCVITDAAGETIITDEVRMLVPLGITAQPENFDGEIGGTAVFTVSAVGSGISYQWQARTAAGTKWSICSSVTNSYKARITDKRAGYVYRCVITDEKGETVTTDEVRMLVPLEIGEQPADFEGSVGERAVFSVAASGTGLSYQWQVKPGEKYDWRDTTSTGCRTAEISIPVTAARFGYRYRCVITDAAGETIITDDAALIRSGSAR